VKIILKFLLIIFLSSFVLLSCVTENDFDYVFQNEAGNVIFNGENFGRADTGVWGIALDSGHIAFRRCEDDVCHLIYDGKDLGKGSFYGMD